ncbi:MAG TPA: futalosine hydrolase [Saprospiraceae bacterium]|nr:futalosine hydrolase [Saprospiraceae bacterium]
MKILLVAATPFEIAPAIRWLEENCPIREDGFFEKNDLAVFPLITGVGMASVAFHTGRFFLQDLPDLAINAGIAGAFDRNLQLGDVLNVVTERYGDLGVEEADGRFTDLFELGLLEPNTTPFINGLLRNPSVEQAAFLPAVHGLTVNKVSGSAASIKAIRAKYPNEQVESMEGAAFFYACLFSNVPFLEIRGISNYVESRNREAWNLPLAIDNLNRVLIEMMESFIIVQS